MQPSSGLVLGIPDPVPVWGPVWAAGTARAATRGPSTDAASAAIAASTAGVLSIRSASEAPRLPGLFPDVGQRLRRRHPAQHPRAWRAPRHGHAHGAWDEPVYPGIGPSAATIRPRSARVRSAAWSRAAALDRFVATLEDNMRRLLRAAKERTRRRGYRPPPMVVTMEPQDRGASALPHGGGHDGSRCVLMPVRAVARACASVRIRPARGLGSLARRRPPSGRRRSPLSEQGRRLSREGW